MFNSVLESVPAPMMMWLQFFGGSSLTLLWVAAIFVPLSKWMPCNPEQPLWRKDTPTDLMYYFFSPILQQAGRLTFIAGFSLLLHALFSKDTLTGYMQTGYGPVATLPIWVQAAIAFILIDFLLYWIHRGFHTRRMWNFHAIHHSPTELDFLSTHRFHFINLWLSFAFVDCLILALGFSPEAVACMATFNILYSAMVHANLNWTFGPFRYVFASPVFHRWHHTTEREALDKNFAPTFPLLDIMFGTFYMPDGKLPSKYGVLRQEIPKSFWAQLDWPFRK